MKMWFSERIWSVTTFIDPADAKDFDDALSFQWLDENLFEVGSIADVTLSETGVALG